jgi:hypothetical protein
MSEMNEPEISLNLARSRFCIAEKKEAGASRFLEWIVKKPFAFSVRMCIIIACL